MTAGAERRCAQIVFVAVARDGEALHRADVDAGVALDAARRGEDRLDIAVEAALHFARGLLGVEAQFHFDVQLLEAARQIDVLHLLARATDCSRCGSSTR